jgi:septin family protein
MVDVDNESHCDFEKLRQMLIKTHLQALKDRTTDHYEGFRRERLIREATMGGGDAGGGRGGANADDGAGAGAGADGNGNGNGMEPASTESMDGEEQHGKGAHADGAGGSGLEGGDAFLRLRLEMEKQKSMLERMQNQIAADAASLPA